VAKLSYLAAIVDWFQAAKDVINARWADEGLPELQHWFDFEPADVPEVDFPFGWWDWIEPEDVAIEIEATDASDFRVYVLLVLTFGAGSATELMELIADAVPHAVAAIEAASDAWSYTVRPMRLLPGPPPGLALTRFVGVVFEVAGFRDWGDVM